MPLTRATADADPVRLKLATTGYRFLRYHAGAREYREKGPPPTLLRAIAPLFVAAHLAFNGREVLRNLHGEWFNRARLPIAGAQVRAALMLASILGGVLVALALASKITGYQIGD